MARHLRSGYRLLFYCKVNEWLDIYVLLYCNEVNEWLDICVVDIDYCSVVVCFINLSIKL